MSDPKPGISPANGSVRDGALLESQVSDLVWRDSYRLGGGLNAITGAEADKAVDFTDTTKVNGSRKKFRIIKIASDEDLKRELATSVEGKYNIEGVDVAGSASLLSKVSYSSSSMTLVAVVESENVGYNDIQSPVLTNIAKEKLERSPREFIEAYGHYFISGQRLGSRLIASYRLISISEKSLNQFKSEFEASAEELFSAAGSAKFKEVASKNGVDYRIEVSTEGNSTAIPVPEKGWTPEAVVEVANKFLNDAGTVPRTARLRHYNTIDHRVPLQIETPLDVFSDVNNLYLSLWAVQAKYNAVHSNYRNKEALRTSFNRVNTSIRNGQARLVLDERLREKFWAELRRLETEVDAILDRQRFWDAVKAALEPEKGSDEHGGGHAWTYGFASWPHSSAVRIRRHEPLVAKEEAPALRFFEAGQHYQNDLQFVDPSCSSIIVGWEVKSGWTDDTKGTWWKSSERILGSNTGVITVKSAWKRGYHWLVTYYTIDAADYDFD